MYVKKYYPTAVSLKGAPFYLQILNKGRINEKCKHTDHETHSPQACCLPLSAQQLFFLPACLTSLIMSSVDYLLSPSKNISHCTIT
jgi:hypothetical protein